MRVIPFRLFGLTVRRGGLQSGSILVNAAIGLLVCLIILGAVQIGYLFYAKRHLQGAADLAALAGARAMAAVGTGTTACNAAGTAVSANLARQSTLGVVMTSTGPVCGAWNSSYTESMHFKPTVQPYNAVLVTARIAPLSLLPGLTPRELTATAVAKTADPLAQLTVRSTLLTVDSDKSALLNAVVGGLLGGSLNVTAAGWNGLLNTQVNLLDYLNALAVDLKLSAGDYATVLDTNVTAGKLLEIMAMALQKSGNTATAAISALQLIQAAANIPSAQPLIKLGDLIGLETGSDPAALNLNMQLFQLVEGVVQLANGKNALSADINLPVAGLANVSAKIRIVEPAQLSAIGNPEMVKQNIPGYDIYVRTAQVRTLVSVTIPALSGVANLLNSVTNLLTPVTSLLNDVLSLNLGKLLNCLLVCDTTATRAVLLSGGVGVDINIDAGGASARLSSYTCSASGGNSLNVTGTTGLADVRIGQFTAAQKVALFNNLTTAPTPSVIPILDVETAACTATLLGLLGSCGTWSPYSRTGLRVDASGVNGVGASSAPLTFNNVKKLNETLSASDYQSLSSSSNLVSSVLNSLKGVQLQTFRYSATATNHLGNTIGAATALVASALSSVTTLVNALLGNLLNAVVNLLLTTLGIDLGKAEIGARMTCDASSELVF